MASSTSMLRNVTITARGARSLPGSMLGGSDPYCVMELNGQRVETSVDSGGGSSPVWNESFRFVLPMERPGETAPSLRVSIMDSNRLLPDRELGSGSVMLTSLIMGEGSEEVQVPLTDKKGSSAGVVMLSVALTLGEQAALGSAAGTSLGTVHMPVGGVPENALPPASQDALHAAKAVEPNPLNAGVATITKAAGVGTTAGVGVGQVENPASAAYGTMM